MLQLNKTNHEYTLDGVRVPSVTQIVRSMELTDFSFVTKDQMTRACDFGNAAHWGSELIDTGKIDWSTVSPGLKEYLDGWVKFRDDCKPQILLCEKMLFSKRWGFAGTLDRVAIVNGKLTIIDIKTSVKVGIESSLQLAGYKMLWEENECKKISQRWIVQLLPEGQYSIHKYSNAGDESVFVSALIVYKFKAKNNLLKKEK